VGACPDVEYVRDVNLSSIAAGIFNRLHLSIGHWDRWNLHQDFRSALHRQVDVLHLFNQVSFGRTPWVTTFESVVPRYRSMLNPAMWAASVGDARVQTALKLLASTTCRGLIAMSSCNFRMQQRVLDLAPRYADAIQSKMHVLHPPQKLLVSQQHPRNVEISGPMRFVLVGASFHRKGGREVLDVLGRLRREGFDLHLTLVSSIQLDPYASGETAADLLSAREEIAANRHWITHHDSLPNDAVLQIMRESHVALLPTYADTYGFSVLEAQACSCPVISTNVRALPEINSSEAGWLIEVPRNMHGEALYATAQERRDLSAHIAAGLENVVRDIFANPGQILAKSQGAIRRIREKHDPAAFSEKLLAIYTDGRSHLGQASTSSARLAGSRP
jgi:glycosyltransferase involved in cell wall biosynthesis